MTLTTIERLVQQIIPEIKHLLFKLSNMFKINLVIIFQLTFIIQFLKEWYFDYGNVFMKLESKQ